jgi:hypothetical protein
MSSTEANKKRAVWRVYLLAVMLAVVVLIAVGIVASETSTCSFLRGTCVYDPRTQHPSSMFISQPPEQPIVQYIRDQIKVGGTFPITATSSVLSVTPIWVYAEGFNNDLHIYARVRVQVQYTDSTDRYFEFDLNAREDTQLFGIANSTMWARFKPISECGVNTMSADSFYCY